jgi:pilus assembly protein Flp/PilA
MHEHLNTTPEESSSPRRVRTEQGASAVEYGLLIAGIAALIVAVVYLFGAQVGTLFQDTCDSVQAKRSAGTCN